MSKTKSIKKTNRAARSKKYFSSSIENKLDKMADWVFKYALKDVGKPSEIMGHYSPKDIIEDGAVIVATDLSLAEKLEMLVLVDESEFTDTTFQDNLTYDCIEDIIVQLIIDLVYEKAFEKWNAYVKTGGDRL